MAYNIDEILGDIRFEVIGDRVILKLKEGVIPEHTNDITNLVKVDDITKPSDSNVFSSLRVLSEIAKAIGSIDVSGSYLRKDVEDTATERINFSKGIKIGNAVLAWDEVSGALRISESVFSDKEVSAYGFGSDHGNGESGSLGGLVNVGQWADEVASSDRVIVQLAGATHWSSMLLSEIVGLDTQALASYLTSNNYATKSYVTGEISNIDFHNHDNKSILDHLTQDDIDVLSHLKLVDGRITLSGNLNFNTSANQINSTSAVELALNYAGGGARHTSIFNGQGGFIMRAHANGNVGIGTSEPQYKLDVNGSVRTGTIIIDEHVSDAGIKINNNSNTYSRIRFFDSAENLGTIHAFTGNQFLFNNQKCINIDSNGAISLGHWNEPNLYINTVNGCVGISNTNPQFKLDVYGASRIYGSLHLNNEGWLNLYNGANTSTISLSHNNASSKLDIYNRTLGNWANVEAGFLTCDTITMKNNLSEKFIRSNAWGGAIRLRANSGAATDRGLQLGRVDNNLSFTSFMAFNGDSGNVSINSTLDNGYKLDVNGSGHYASELYLDYGLRISNAAGSGEGISLFAESSTNPNYGLMFARTIYKGTHGSVNGDWATYFTMSPDAGRGWIFTSNAAGTGGNVVSISNWGNLTCSGEVTAYSASDRRLKTDIVTLKDSLRIIELLNPVSYKWNSIAKELNPMKGDEKDYGLIAQELECVMPELVHSIYDGKYKSIDYVKLIPHLVCAIKELKMEVDRLKK